MWFEADSYTFPPVVDFYPGGPDHHPGRWSGTSAIQDGFGAFERGDFSERHPFISSGTSDEWSEIATSKVSVRTMNEDEGPIVVTGTRYSRLDTYSWWDSGPGADYWTVHSEDTGGLEREPDCTCSGMTEAQRQEQAIDAEVADILREITAQANQNMEYGSLIWRDSTGALHHTSLAPSPDYHTRFDASSLPMNADGTTDFSGVVAMVHSHPAFLPDGLGGLDPYFTSSSPDRLLYPSQTHTRDGVVQGDWITFDYYAAQIAADGGNAAGFTQYVIGFDGQKLVIKEYDAADRETATSADGETVDPNTEDCTC